MLRDRAFVRGTYGDARSQAGQLLSCGYIFRIAR